MQHASIKLLIPTSFRLEYNIVGIYRRLLLFLALLTICLLLSTIETREQCECGLEHGHYGEHRKGASAIEKIVAHQRLKQREEENRRLR
jgi:hypothetical protein